MRTPALWLLVTVLAGGPAVVQAQSERARTEHGIPDAPTRLTNVATNETGTIIKKVLRWRSPLPLDKTYGELTAEQKGELRGLYESLPEADEPPYPVSGMKPVFYQLKKGHHILQPRGELNLRVTVDADGKVTKVEDYGGVLGANAHEMTNFAQSVFMMTEFKPGTCAGKPCVMQFPFKLKM